MQKGPFQWLIRWAGDASTTPCFVLSEPNKMLSQVDDQLT